MWKLLPLSALGGLILLSFGGMGLFAEEPDAEDEVLQLKGEMLKMKMDYEGKLGKMEERLQRLEEGNPRTAHRPR
ncbi:MAG TPA: hypothetical protein ACFYEM_11670 [Candidatus Hypogeohydataceae bacterium YC40]